MTDHVTVSLKCPRCGAAPETDDDRTDASVVRCSNPDCDTEFGTWGEVREQAKQAAADYVKQEIQKTFKGSKLFKVK